MTLILRSPSLVQLKDCDDMIKRYFRELFTRTKLDRGSIKMFEQIQVSVLRLNELFTGMYAY